jgi:hypothetical protein
MAGKKITKTAIAKLDDVGEERIMEYYVHERSVLSLLKRLKPKTGLISVGIFYKWLHQEGGRWGRWKEAKKLIADLLAEETYELSRDTDSRNVQVSRLQVNTNQWLAERYNKEEYGKGAEESGVTVSIGATFLAALKEIEEERKAALLADVPKAKFEIIEED